MQKLWIIFTLILMSVSGAVKAQDTPLEERFAGRVKVDSAFARLAPDFEAQPVASLVKNDRLVIVSRSLDGTWFEVKRPGRLTNLGWIFNEVLEWKFKPENLPLGDLTTGLKGPTPLTSKPKFGAYLNEEATLRRRPSRSSEIITRVPPLLTVPVLERNQDGSWLHINYLGYDGWIIGFAVRELPNVLDIPLAPGLPPLETISVLIIPVEVQQGQIDRLRVYVLAQRERAFAFQGFWWRVYRGEIMPCDIPADIEQYRYSPQDVRELPELGRYVPRLGDAVNYLDKAINPLKTCGVVSPQTVVIARDSAINAHIIYTEALSSLAELERNVVQARRPRKPQGGTK